MDHDEEILGIRNNDKFLLLGPEPQEFDLVLEPRLANCLARTKSHGAS